MNKTIVKERCDLCHHMSDNVDFGAVSDTNSHSLDYHCMASLCFECSKHRTFLKGGVLKVNSDELEQIRASVAAKRIAANDRLTLNEHDSSSHMVFRSKK